VRELQPGLWHWEAPHPEWQSGEWWPEQVSSYALDDGERLFLFDPLALPGELDELAGRREAAIVLTCPWHERDTRGLVERLGTPVFAPPPDTEEDLMRKYDVTAEQVAGGSPDLAWLVAGEAGEGHFYSAGVGLPAGIEAFAGRGHNDVVLWIESRRAVIAGDTLVDFGQGLEISPAWLPKDMTRKQLADGLRPLLSLPVELVLATHGGPNDLPALERALSDP
jgi:glyoxylase-like metal-dependent hydrolase (beta-lactamase superfamily II)